LRIVTIVAAVLLLGGIGHAQAGIVVTVDKTAQRLTVDIDGVTRHQWPVSTARWGYRTPNGSYRPQRLERQWYSRKYDWSPMPHSIFFNGGYAIHGSYEVSRLGRPASHGCIRLHPQNAAILFDLVRRNTNDTRIVVTGGGPELMARSRVPTRQETYRQIRYEEPREWRRTSVRRNAPRHADRHVERKVERNVDRRTQRQVHRDVRRVSRYSRNFEEVFSDAPEDIGMSANRRRNRW
jgi:hypothetical protein